MMTTTSSISTVVRSLKWCVQLGLIPAAASTSIGQQQQQQQDTYQQRIQEMRHQYQNLVDQFPFPDEGHENDHDDDHKDQQQQDAHAVAAASASSDGADTTSFLDPLTAMVMEQESRTERLQKLDLKYRKEKAMRHRGKAVERNFEEEEIIDPRVERSVTLQVIDKDLARLPPPPPSSTLSSSPLSPSEASPSSSSSSELTFLSEHAISKRKAILRRVLYCFHCATHDTPGYRQGMHEIASYLLHALEIEQQEENNNNETTTNATNGGCGGGDEDDDDDTLGAQVYSMLHAILMTILPAYDVASSHQQQPTINNTATANSIPTSQHAVSEHHHYQVHDKNKPLEGMSRRILAQVAIHDAVLCRRLQVDLQVPAQLYLTKWIRLLYSREVASNQVLFFWDALLELMTTSTTTSTTSTTSTTTTSLMSVLETVAAARLLLWRGRLHVPPPPPTAATGQDPHQHQHDDHDTLHLLMNLPMETLESTREWLQLSRQMICYNQSRQLLWSTCVKDQPPLPLVTLPPLTVVPGVVVPSPATVNNSSTAATSSTFAASAAARMNIPSSVFGAASSNNNNNTSNPIMDRFSFTSVRQNLEQAVKSTTQSIGQRLHQEWEHLAADLGGGGGGGGVSPAGGTAVAAATTGGGTYNAGGGVGPSLRSNNRAAGTTTADAYSVSYRNDSPLFDPPVPPARAVATMTSGNINNIQLLQQQHAAWARQLQVQTATLQSFLIQVEQEHERHHGSNLNQNHNRVPPIVWEALATLETMRLEMTSYSTSPSP